MADFQETVQPRELICELALDGALAGRYRIVENVDVTRDGSPFSNANRTRELTAEEGAAIIASGSAAAAAENLALHAQIATLQGELAAMAAERDQALMQRDAIKAKALEAITASQPLVQAVAPS